jgi:hypothetical protein
MTMQKSAGGLVALFVLAGCAPVSVAGRSSMVSGAHIVARSAPSSAARPAADTRSEPNEPNVELRLSSRFVPAPGVVRSAIRVKRHPDNRLLRVAVDSGNYFRSSAIELDGAHSARTHFLTWSSLPEGTYSLVATVYGSDGLRSRQTETFEVRGAPGGSTR